MSGDPANFIFDWRRTRWSGWLPACLALSLLGHLLCFYAFHIVYPSTATLLPAAASVGVLNRQVESDRRLLEWVDLQDPGAITAPTFRPERLNRLLPRYGRAEGDAVPTFVPLDPPARDGFPPIFGPDGALTNRPAPAPAPAAMFPSRLEPSSTLPAPLAPPPLPRALAPLEPTVLFLGVDPSGAVSLCLPWRSSGSPAQDRAAESYARALRFAPALRAGSGTLRFVWGYDGP